MTLRFNTDRKIGRNEKCPCGMGLKFKHCHGDESKKNIVQRVADETMTRLIINELLKKGLICKHGVRKGEECFDCENPDVNIEPEQEKENDGNIILEA